MVRGKKGIERDVLIDTLIVIAIIIFCVVAYMILNGKMDSAIGAINNIFGFK